MSDGFMERLGPGGVHLAMSTVLPETSRRLAALHAQHGSAYVAAPVFGRPEAAVARQLWIPFAGPEAAKTRVRPLLQAMGAQGLFDFGDDVGAASIVKLIGNFLIVSAARSLDEALSEAAPNGADPKAVIDMLTSTLFDAPIYRSYGARIASGAAHFESPIPLKDVGLLQETGRESHHRMPIASPLRDLLQDEPARA